MNAFWLTLLAGAAFAKGDVKPCQGAKETDYFNYCCPNETNVPLLMIADLESVGFAEKLILSARRLLEPHRIKVGVRRAELDLSAFDRRPDNLPELCLVAASAVNSHISEVKGLIPVIFTTYGAAAKQGPDSNGMHIGDLIETCGPAIREYHTDPAKAKDILDRMPPAKVIILNKAELEKRVCDETLAHEIGHAVGLGHSGDGDNIMGACDPKQPRSKLSHQQVRPFCGWHDFNWSWTP